MNEVKIMSLEKRVKDLWDDGDQKDAIQTVQKHFGKDSLTNALSYVGFSYRNHVLLNLQERLKKTVGHLTDPEDNVHSIRVLVDTIQYVQNQDDYIFDVSMDLLNPRPIDRDGFLQVIDDLNAAHNDLN